MEYGDLLVEAFLVVNGETEIHRYSYSYMQQYDLSRNNKIMHRVTWIQLQGTKYMEGCAVVLDSSEILPTFGVIINVLLIKPDEPYFVCELLQTEEFSIHFHSFIVQRNKPIPIVFCKPDELSDHHTLGLYNLRLNHDTISTYYVVPQYHLM